MTCSQREPPFLPKPLYKCSCCLCKFHAFLLKYLACVFIEAKCLVCHALPMEKQHQATEDILIRWVLFEKQTENRSRLSWHLVLLIGFCEPESTLIAGLFHRGPTTGCPLSFFVLQNHAFAQIRLHLFEQSQRLGGCASITLGLTQPREGSIHIRPQQGLLRQ